MMPNDALIGSLALVALSMLGISMMWFEDVTARKASMFFAFPVILVMAFYMLSIPSLSFGNPFTMNVVSNTIYQNTNSTPLAIYATTHSATLRGYLGNSTSLTKIISIIELVVFIRLYEHVCAHVQASIQFYYLSQARRIAEISLERCGVRYCVDCERS